MMDVKLSTHDGEGGTDGHGLAPLVQGSPAMSAYFKFKSVVRIKYT